MFSEFEEKMKIFSEKVLTAPYKFLLYIFKGI